MQLIVIIYCCLIYIASYALIGHVLVWELESGQHESQRLTDAADWNYNNLRENRHKAWEGNVALGWNFRYWIFPVVF
jgi:hypothetical protein